LTKPHAELCLGQWHEPTGLMRVWRNGKHLVTGCSRLWMTNDTRSIRSKL
jgi:hypothetical protein